MSILVPLLLCLPTPQAADHSPLHPAEAAWFVQAPDASAWADAYSTSRWADVFYDEDFRADVAEAQGWEPLHFEEAIAAIPAQVEANPSVRAFLEHARALQTVSASLCFSKDELLLCLKEGRDPQTAFHFRVLAEFPTPDQAQQAGAFLRQELEIPTGPALRAEGAFLIASYGTLATSEQPGPPLPERWGTLGQALGPVTGVTLIQAYGSLGDQPIQWAEEWLGTIGMEGPLGQWMTSLLGAPFLAISRGGAWRVTAQDGSFLTSGRYAHRPASLVDEAFGAKPLTASDFAHLHPDARVAGALSLDREALFGWAQSLAAFYGLEEDEEAVVARLGFHPVRDLVEPLGGSLVWSLQGNLRLGSPPCQLTATLSDQAAMQKGLKALTHWAASDLAEYLEIKTVNYRDTELFVVRSQGGDSDFGSSGFDPSTLLAPTVTVIDGRLLITPTSSFAKREIRRIQKEDSEPAALAKAFQGGIGQGSIVVGDWMFLLDRATELARNVGQMDPSGSMESVLQKIPALNHAVRHFGPSVETRQRTEPCMHYESRSHVGPESVAALLVGVGLAAQQVVPRVLDSLDDAKRGRCAADLAALGGAVRRFALKNGGDYPESLQMLVTPDESGRRYIESDSALQDPWGNPYHYSLSADGRTTALWSSGPNEINELGQGDDLTYQNLLDGKW